MDEDILAIGAIFLCVFTPIAGLTLRVALKPIVDSIARLLEARASTTPALAAAEMSERRLTLMEAELSAVRSELQRVSEQRDFMEQLGAGR
jgi:hypothetical protein